MGLHALRAVDEKQRSLATVRGRVRVRVQRALATVRVRVS